MRDYKKFCRPKTTNNPKSGDYKVILNEGTTVYVEKNEFEKKTSKFFKNYLVVGDNLEDNHDYSLDYLTFEALEDGIITFKYHTSVSTEKARFIEHSTDGGMSWTKTNNVDDQSVTVTIDVSKGDKILWRGDNDSLGIYGGWVSKGSCFTSTCEFDAKGNIMSLIYGDEFKGKTTIENDYEFSNLFWDTSGEATYIINAKDLILPAKVLANNCYMYMFGGCTSLTTAPKLPATTLANYCYNSMFTGCTNLTAAPLLPTTTLAEGCYSQMFNGCRSLTAAPELPATTLVNNCYANMFANCTNLTTAPQLLATTLASYCYNQMFNNCTSLNSITCLATDISAANCTLNWVNDVAVSGTFTKNKDMTDWTYGVDGIPESWDVEEI